MLQHPLWVRVCALPLAVLILCSSCIDTSGLRHLAALQSDIAEEFSERAATSRAGSCRELHPHERAMRMNLIYPLVGSSLSGIALTDYNVEQQAEIVRDYFRLLNGRKVPGPHRPILVRRKSERTDTDITKPPSRIDADLM